MNHEEYKRKALEPIVNYIESVMASYSKEELEARIKKALPEKESEDERIIKIIKRQMCHGAATPTDEERAMVDAWLEKQKEQKPRYTAYLDLSSNEFEACMLRYLQSAANRKDDAMIMIDTKGYAAQLMEIARKEQKPALTPERIRPKFAVGDTVCRPMYCDHTIREIYVRCNDPVYVCMNDEGLESHISLSEQDEWEIKEQKPVEWSKEDEKMLKDFLHKVEVCDLLTNKENVWIVKKLKSLQPHWKPSEE